MGGSLSKSFPLLFYARNQNDVSIILHNPLARVSCTIYSSDVAGRTDDYHRQTEITQTKSIFPPPQVMNFFFAPTYKTYIVPFQGLARFVTITHIQLSKTISVCINIIWQAQEFLHEPCYYFYRVDRSGAPGQFKLDYANQGTGKRC